MRTLHVGLRVADRERSIRFYSALGYVVVGEVPETEIGHLTMLQLPGDEFVSIELVHHPAGVAVGVDTRLSHLVVQVESMADVIARLHAHDVEAGPPTSPDGSRDFLTSSITDPDGNRIELVQWPMGHPPGMTRADLGG